MAKTNFKESTSVIGLLYVAYEVLSDESKKFIYDRLGKEKLNEPQQHIEMQYDLRTLKGPELRMKVYLPLKDFYIGKELPILV